MSETGLALVTGSAVAGTCSLPSSLVARLGWITGERVRIAFGSAVVGMRIRPADENVWRMPTSALNHLGTVPRRWRYRIDSQRKMIFLGPLIGIMTTWRVTPYFRSVMRAAASRGMMAVVLRPSDLRPGRRISAWGLVNGKMRRLRVPWPDVVYNRIPNRGGEMSASTRMCKTMLRRATVPIFNGKFFHKWRIHRLLRRDELAQEYLPETQPLRNFAQVYHFLAKYPTVYLKPNGGSKGEGIVRVSRVRGRGYVVSFRRGHRNYRLSGVNWGEVEPIIRRAMHRRTYVVQEGLKLASYRGRPFDVRVTLYKNGAGEWVPCGPVAKIAGPGSITTHVRNGGRVIPLDRALQFVFADQAKEMRGRIETASVELALAVERVTAMQLGELGLDIGVTANGRVAMFEANSKPGRAVFTPAWARRDRRESLQHLCDYAAFLAQQVATR